MNGIEAHMKYKVGDRVIDRFHQEDMTIVAVNEQQKRYTAKLDRLPDVGPFDYWENDLDPWYWRRFVVDGNHYMKMYDCTNSYDPQQLGLGSWGVRDRVEDRVVFYITSGHSRAVAMEIAKQMNENKLLKELT